VLKTAETVCLEIFREIIREVRQYNVKNYWWLQRGSRAFVGRGADMLAELESFLKVSVKFRVKASKPKNNTMLSCLT